jgi:hypothetical protein
MREIFKYTFEKGLGAMVYIPGFIMIGSLIQKLMGDARRHIINYVALVREQTIPIQRPPLLGVVSANFYG